MKARKTIFMCIAVVILLGLFGCFRITAHAETSGVYEYYTLNDNTVQISGYSGSDANVTIPSKLAGRTVTGIAKEAFYDNQRISSVKIPNTVKYIEEEAFRECKNLVSIEIPNTVTSIGERAFYECENLVSVTIPSGIKTISESAFAGCTNLTKVTIPNGVISIGESAFGNCQSLANIDIPSSVMSINANAFGGCSSLKKVTLPSSVRNIGKGAFRECSNLSSITIPNSVVSIGENAFTYCKSLSSITLPNSITSINASVFSNCNTLKTITFSNSIKSIGEDAFWYCDNLSYVNYKGTLKQWKSISIYENNNSAILNATVYCNDGGVRNDSTLNSLKVGQKSVKATWSKVAGATGYEVQIATDSKFKKDSKKVVIKKQSTTSTTFKNLKANKKYYVRVRSYKVQQVGNQSITNRSSWSKTKSITTPVQKPNSTKIKSLKAGKESVKVNWSKVSKVKGYQIQISTNSKFSYNNKTITVNKQTTTAKTIKKLEKGSKYYVHIRTYNVQKVNGKNKTIYSSWSKVKSVKTK